MTGMEEECLLLVCVDIWIDDHDCIVLMPGMPVSRPLEAYSTGSATCKLPDHLKCIMPLQAYSQMSC